MEYINRTTNKVKSNKYHVYSTMSPINYKKDDGSYEPIDLSFEDSTSTIGDISLNRKNVFSTGIRKDNNPSKFVGIRPDNCQDGSKQIELSIENVKINSEEGYNIEDFVISPNPYIFLQLYRNNGFKDFEIQYKIHLKGVSIQNEKYTETTKIRNSLKTEFINLGQDTGANILNHYATDTTITDSDSYLRIYYGQISDEFMIKFDKENVEEFRDSDLSSYNFYNMEGNGSSTYLKDCIAFYIVGKDINELSDSVLLNICNKYGLSLEGADEDTGKYFFKDGKKVGGYAIYNETKILGYLNTKDIPNDVKNLFIAKDFDETSFIDLSISQFNIDIKEQFNYDVNSIEVGNNYYQGDLFNILIGNRSYFIGLPIIMDNNHYPISSSKDTTHTLKDNGDGTYTYTKYLTIEGLLRNLGNSLNYIDVNITTGFDEHSPGYAFSGTTVNIHTQGNSDTMRDATTGNQWTFIPYGNFIDGFQQKNVGTGGTNRSYRHYQFHWKFHTGGITNATALKWKHKSRFVGTLSGSGASYGSLSGVRYQLFKSTGDQDLSTNSSAADVKANWNEVTGHTSSWTIGDLTDYSSSTDITDTSFDWREDILNADAISDFNSASDFKVACMEVLDYADGAIETSWTVGTSTSTARKVFNVINTVLGGAYPEEDFHYLEATVPSVAATDNAPFIGTNF